MGDSKRNIIFAQFIRRNFPPKKYHSVLVVADGHGILAAQLAKWYKVRVVENKPRQKIKRKAVSYTKGWFEKNSIVTEDFIVAMHPDEATGPVVMAARQNNKRFAIVPCCIKGGLETHGVSGFTAWILRLKSLYHKPVNETLLPFSGKNMVLYS